MTNKKITIKDGQSNNEAELPVLESILGPDVVDIRALEKDLGYLSHDPGFMATSSCESKITFIDGNEGKLWYRGYPIEELAEKSNFIETAYLLLNDKLPNNNELELFSKNISSSYNVDPAIKNIIEVFDKSSHPMAIMTACLSYLSAKYHDNIDIQNKDYRYKSTINLISSVPVISAWILNYILSEQFQEPSEKRSIAENFINMAFPKLDPDQKNLSSKAMDIIFLLHADHEQNASTSTVRLSGSSETSPYAAIAAGISTLWGPTHGGANEAVINMLEEIKNSDKDVEHYINMAKDKENTFRLMGFGHRIYKNYDPRAKIIQKIAHEYLSQLDNTNPNKPLFDIAMKLEKFALEDDYFVSRKLYPNVDFYSGIVLKAIGIPQSMYTVIFALARTVGWVAHWNEMIEDKNFRIGRPRQLYTGKNKTSYRDIKDR
ncbi:MAG: citrate synthase [Gammaproteobacteria bacterium]|jgi:citrate synthase|nr:citrate synthase [Gammaproteobacteria bacterium]